MRVGKYLFLAVIFTALSAFSFGKKEDYQLPKGDTNLGVKVEMLKQLEKGFAAIAKKVQPAVVFISISKTVSMPDNPFFNFEDLFRFGQPFNDHRQGQRQRRQRPQHERKFEQKGAGSGFIIDIDKGYVVTNNHVVGDADEITVVTSDKKEYKAKVIATDPQTDIAVIQVKDLPKKLGQLFLDDSNLVRVGHWAFAVGAPYQFPQTLTKGVVSAIGRAGRGITEYGDFIQTDAAINQGNSGGPLINSSGNVIGMNTFIVSQSGASAGLGFAISSNLIKDVVPQLISKGKVSRAQLGVYIKDLDKDLASEFGLNHTDGVLIESVMPNSPAQKAKLQSGDIILEFNGQKINDTQQLRLKISLAPIDKKLELVLSRNGKQFKKTIVLKPFEKEKEQRVSSSDRSKSWGLTVENITSQHRREFNLSVKRGVVITQVENRSIAAKAGLKEGDVVVEVSRQTVSNIRDFEKLTRKKDKMLLRIARRDHYTYILMKK